MILAHEHGGRAHKSELIVLKCFPIGTLLADTLALLAGCSLVGSSLVHRIRHRVSVCSCFLLRFVCVCVCALEWPCRRPCSLCNYSMICETDRAGATRFPWLAMVVNQSRLPDNHHHHDDDGPGTMTIWCISELQLDIIIYNVLPIN